MATKKLLAAIVLSFVVLFSTVDINVTTGKLALTLVEARDRDHGHHHDRRYRRGGRGRHHDHRRGSSYRRSGHRHHRRRYSYERDHRHRHSRRNRWDRGRDHYHGPFYFHYSRPHYYHRRPNVIIVDPFSWFLYPRQSVVIPQQTAPATPATPMQTQQVEEPDTYYSSASDERLEALRRRAMRDYHKKNPMTFDEYDTMSRSERRAYGRTWDDLKRAAGDRNGPFYNKKWRLGDRK
jgi:hypothetical protein